MNYKINKNEMQASLSINIEFLMISSNLKGSTNEETITG